MSEKVINPSSAGVEDGATSRGIDASLFNDDLAPAKSRDWSFYSLFAMWMSDIHSIGGYTFAAGLFALGLSAALLAQDLVDLGLTTSKIRTYAPPRPKRVANWPISRTK